MIRTIKKQLSGKDALALPGSHNAAPRRGFRFGSSQHDGSAASIHTAPTLAQAWHRSSGATRTSWIALVTSVLMIWQGWRWIRYSHAGISLTCHSVTCELRVTPLGWGKKVEIDNLARHQLQTAVAVKTASDGTFVTDQNVVLTEPYTKNSSKKAKHKKVSSYKGPDENGHFLSYAILLSDIGHATPMERPNDAEEPSPEASLAPLMPYLEKFTIDTGEPRFRLIPRAFGVKQSRRRVRTMVQKFDSYVKRRRQKLVVKENAPPAWQGVLLLVFGFVAVFVTAVVGQFRDPSVSRSGVRRGASSSRPSPHGANAGWASRQETLRSTTPAQYEVSTKSGVRRPNATAARRRGT